MIRRSWTDAERALLRQWWAENVPQSDIAKRLRRSGESIRHQAGEMGLGARAKPVVYAASEIAPIKRVPLVSREAYPDAYALAAAHERTPAGQAMLASMIVAGMVAL